MRRTRIIVALALANLFFVSTSSAQQASTTSVPNLIRYGGVLKDAQGVALSSSSAVGVTFSIYKQQDGGAPVWMETQNVTSDASGQYSVLLGSTTATGLPGDLFSQEEQRWLGVQVQGQAEQPRVLLVSVPYAFKAHEAETLGGKTISDFVLAKDVNAANSGAGVASASSSASTQTGSGKTNAKSPSNLATAQGPTNFSGTTTDQIVSAVQSGTGKAIVASSSTGNAIVANTTSATTTTYAVSGTIPGAGVAILGHASSATAQGYGIQGTSDSNIGVGLLGFATATTGSTYGLKGYSSSTGGTGVRGLSTATTGVTYGVSGAVSSPNGTAMWGQTVAANGGTGLWGQSLATTGAGTGVLATAASTAGTGIVATESAATGTTYGLNAKVQSASGTAVWLQNTAGGPLILATTGPSTSPVLQFSVDGRGTVKFGGNLATLSIGSAADDNLFLGTGAGAVNVAGSGQDNAFLGALAGNSNTTGGANVFSGAGAGFSNTTGGFNVFTGAGAGYSNTTGFNDTFTGQGAGYMNTTADGNTFTGVSSGFNNTTGVQNTFDGGKAGYSNTTGTVNSFLGYNAGNANTTGSYNTFVGTNAGFQNTTASRNTFVGTVAGQSNTTGIRNTFLGEGAGFVNTTGNDNTFVGRVAGDNNQAGNQDLFLGTLAGQNNVSGSNDIYLANSGPFGGSESNTIRIGDPANQTAAYVAGIYGNSPSGALPVVINSSGQLGTGSSGGAGVSSWNGRTGAVVPVANDYSFSMLSGTLGGSQLSGTYGSAITLSNTSNVYYGNGSNLTGVVAGSGSPYYIQNGTSQQSSANFNISGSGSANTFISGTTYQAVTMVGPSVVLSIGNGINGDLFLGQGAGSANGSGSSDTFSGAYAGNSNTTGSQNTFVGEGAGQNNTVGGFNTFIGQAAGGTNMTGGANTYVGLQAGYETEGSGNVYLGSQVGLMLGSESNTMRLGNTSFVFNTYIAGIYGSTSSSGIPVYINSNGQLGTTTSSRRFKEQILDMGDSSSRLFQLRPVTFLYKPEYDDGSHTLQYGLIAEEVAKVYPDMVAYDRDGAPYTVKYQYLAPMLLNELQKQHSVVTGQQDIIKTQQEQIQTQGQQIADLQQRLSRLESLIDKK